MTDPRLTPESTTWVDGDAPADAAPISGIWRDPGGAALALAPVYLVDAGGGDLTLSTTGPAVASFIDTRGTGVYELTLLPTEATGPQPTMLGLGGNILVYE